jgi:hypothetical protein
MDSLVLESPCRRRLSRLPDSIPLAPACQNPVIPNEKINGVRIGHCGNGLLSSSRQGVRQEFNPFACWCARSEAIRLGSEHT